MPPSPHPTAFALRVHTIANEIAMLRTAALHRTPSTKASYARFFFFCIPKRKCGKFSGIRIPIKRHNDGDRPASLPRHGKTNIILHQHRRNRPSPQGRADDGPKMYLCKTTSHAAPPLRRSDFGSFSDRASFGCSLCSGKKSQENRFLNHQTLVKRCGPRESVCV